MLAPETLWVPRRQLMCGFERRYHAAVYFCAPDAHRQLSRLQAKGGWPKLELRELPDPEEVRL